MKRFTSTFVALAVLAAVGQAAQPESKNAAADAKAGKSPPRRSAAAPTAPASPFAESRPNAPTVLSGQESPSERKIREALNQPTQIEFVETPLKDVVEYLKDLHHIEIQLDTEALKEAGVEESAQVTKNLKGISLRSALRLVLDEKQLKYVIHNEVLMITSFTKAESEDYMETWAYPVQDLVLPKRDGSLDLQPLEALLTNTVATKSWVDNGGTGTLSHIVIGTHVLLVISQTQEIHEEIENVLDMLRKAAGLKPDDAKKPADNKKAENNPFG